MKHKPRGYWTKERCHEIALNYKTRKEFGVNSSSVYQYALKYGWLDEICSHMLLFRKPKRYWTKELCHKEALKFNTRKDFEDECGSAYQYARKYGWLDEVCSHMIRQVKPNGYWTKERCHEVALTCKTRKEFGVKYPRAYRNSRINGWLDEVCSHMVQTKIPKGFWNKEKCHIESLKYNQRKKFQKCSSAYEYARKNGFLDEICSHMIPMTRPMGYWKEYGHCEEAAKKCKNIQELCVKYSGAYRTAEKNGWLHKFFPNSPIRKRKNRQ